jgi:hypothetical protein
LELKVEKSKAKITIKTVAKILIYPVVILLSLITTVYIVFRNPVIQGLSVKMAAQWLSKELHADITIGGFDLSWRNGLVIEDVKVKDQANTDLFSAHRLSVVPERIGIAKKILRVRKIYIGNGTFQLITHKGDSILNLQHILDYFASAPQQKTVRKTPSRPWKIFVGSVEIRDTRFHFQDENEPATPVGMDYSNIDVNHINLFIRNFYPDGDTIHAEINWLSAMERSGLALRSMSGKFQVGPGFLKAKELKLITDHCNLDLDFEFTYKSWDAYSDFLNKVGIHATIRPTIFDLQDVGFFAPELLSMKDRFKIAGEVKGKVGNFKAKDFQIAYGSSTVFLGNISANGLPNVEETFVDLKIRTCLTTIGDIESFRLPSGAANMQLPALLKNAGTYNLRGTFTGFYNDFVANAKLKTELGELTTDLTLRKQKGVRDLSYIGEADVANLNLDRLFQSGQRMGNITFRADINGKGLDLNTTDVEMNVHVDSVEVNRYNYRDIDIKGALAEKNFSGLMEVNDPNLQMDFNGLVDFADSLPEFNFTSNINHARLSALHLVTRNPYVELTTRLKVNFSGNDIDNIEGIINVDNLIYTEGKNTAAIGHLSLLTSMDQQKNRSYHLLSDIADADFTGHFKFRELIPSMDIFISNYLANFQRKQALQNHPVPTDQLVNFKVTLKQTNQVAAIFAPFIRVAPNSLIEGYYDENKEMIFVTGKSKNIDVYGTHLSNWYLNATNVQDNLNINSGCEKLILKKGNNKDTLDISIDSIHLVSDIRRDSILYHFTWVDPISPSEMKGFVNFSANPEVEIRMEKFHVRLDKRYWEMSSDNYALIDTSFIALHNVALRSENQELKLDGRISANKTDTMHVSFSNLDISDFDQFLANPNVNVDGILSGTAKVTDLYSSPILISDLHIGKLKFNRELLGDANFNLQYNSRDKRFDAISEIIYTGNAGMNVPLKLSGSYYMDSQQPRLDFDLQLKSLNLKMVAPFVSSFMSGIYGFVSGDVKITGRPDHPILKGKLGMARTEFKINYLNVSYSLADNVTVDSNYFGFNRVAVYDSLGNIAYVTGKITHKNFSDLAVDLNIDVEDFSVFHNTYKQNNLFYGNARGTGNVRIIGPIDNILVDVKASNTGGTHVVIPISSTADISDNDYIVFESSKTDIHGKQQNKTLGESKGFSLNLAMHVTPAADIEVFFPNDLGNIKASGQGDISMNMTPASSFNMTGTYTIQRGSFLFQFKNLMRLTFAVSDGSKITWSGDASDANIALNAIYRSRVSLGGLTTDPDKKSVRVPVECIVRLQGKLANPSISFGLELPNADEETKAYIYGAIDTTNKVVMNDQMFNILVLNQFGSPSGATAPSLNVGTTSISILTNAFNSMLSKVSKNVALNVNYNRSTTSPGQEIDLGFSTQLFDDRWIIDGLFGVNSMNPNSATEKASTIVADINLQYVLSKNRRWRAKMFNRTNTIGVLDNNALYTQGIGISYQRDFDRWDDLLKKDKKAESKTEYKKK